MFLDSIFGVELPLPVKLVVAFVVVLALIGLATWALRRIGGDRIGAPAARGRQPRLAVIDAAAVDGRRRLVLIRRDNVEHLIMIGGPTDVVVEQNIVRAVPVTPPREGLAARGSTAEAGTRMLPEPLPRNAMEGMRPVSSPDIAPRAPQPRSDAAGRTARPYDPRRTSGEAPREALRPARTHAEREPPPVEMHPAPPTADANLSDMAQRLEAALRRQPAGAREPLSARDPSKGTKEPQGPETPGAPAARSAASSPQAGVVEGAQAGSGGAAATAASRSSEADLARAEPKAAPQKSVIDSLEQEMASLLGRPPNKEP
jgi:flagellar protein FliO/FliZ